MFVEERKTITYHYGWSAFDTEEEAYRSLALDAVMRDRFRSRSRFKSGVVAKRYARMMSYSDKLERELTESKEESESSQ